MPATQSTSAPSDDPVQTSTVQPRRFVASSAPREPVVEEPKPSPRERVRELVLTTHPTTRIIVAGAAGLSVLSLMGTAIFTEPSVPFDSTVAAYDAAQAGERDAQSRTEALAGIDDPAGVVTQASETAQQIVDLQTGAARDTAAIDEASSMDADQVHDLARQMEPYFEDTDAEALGPWYLAAADVEADAGVGFGSKGFDSTVTWTVDSAATINEDGTVPVRFSAYETDTLDNDAPVLLAWATAEFDPRSDSMHGLVTGTTQDGDAAQLKVGA